MFECLVREDLDVAGNSDQGLFLIGYTWLQLVHSFFARLMMFDDLRF
jgi:hypothetical protein